MLCLPDPEVDNNPVAAVDARERFHQWLRDPRTGNPNQINNNPETEKDLLEARNVVLALAGAEGTATNISPWQKSSRDLDDVLHGFNKGNHDNEKLDFVRVVNAATAQKLLMDEGSKPEPLLVDKRRRDLAKLLTWEGARIYSDYWFDVDDNRKNDPPYYARGQSACLEDAKLLDPARESEKSVRTRPPAFWTSVWPANDQDYFVVGNEKLTLKYQANVSDTKPLPGFFTLEYPYGTPGGASKRQALLLDKEITKEVPVPPLEWSATQEKVGFQAYFRGRYYQDPRNIRPLAKPQIAFGRYGTVEKAGVSVWADSALKLPLKGKISIVLDYSGSMNDATPGGKGSKRDLMIEALIDVLKDMTEGLKITIWVFGDEKRSPTNTKPYIGILKGFNDQSVSPKLLKDLREKLRELDPYAFTPLVRSMIMAKDELLKLERDPSEERQILVITDGRDTLFCNDDGTNDGNSAPKSWPGDELHNQYLNKKMSGVDQIKETLKDQFGRKTANKIKLNMIFVWTDVDELETAKKQFDIIQTFDPPGFIASIRTIDDLKDELRKALTVEPKFTVHYAKDETTVPLSKGEQAKRVVLKNRNWDYYEPVKGHEKYYVEVPWAGKSDPFTLERGDYVILEMFEKKSGAYDFRPINYLQLLEKRLAGVERMPAQGLEGAGTGDWSFAPLQTFQPSGNKPIQFLLTLEKRLSDRIDAGEIPKIQRPVLVWLEVSNDRSGKTLVPSSWQREFGFPAYTIGIQVPKTSEQLGYQCWWADKLPSAAATRVLAKVLDKPEPIDLPGLRARLTMCQIQSEKKVDIPTPVGEAEPRKPQNALVIRVQYEPRGDPVLARLERPEELGATHWQHNFYHEAGIVESIYWDVQAEKSLDAEIQFISINRFKKTAWTSGLQRVPDTTERDRSTDLLKMNLR